MCSCSIDFKRQLKFYRNQWTHFITCINYLWSCFLEVYSIPVHVHCSKLCTFKAWMTIKRCEEGLIDTVTCTLRHAFRLWSKRSQILEFSKKKFWSRWSRCTMFRSFRYLCGTCILTNPTQFVPPYLHSHQPCFLATVVCHVAFWWSATDANMANHATHHC